jgi:hypothetical protein
MGIVAVGEKPIPFAPRSFIAEPDDCSRALCTGQSAWASFGFSVCAVGGSWPCAEEWQHGKLLRFSWVGCFFPKAFRNDQERGIGRPGPGRDLFENLLRYGRGIDGEQDLHG